LGFQVALELEHIEFMGTLILFIHPFKDFWSHPKDATKD
jgi:hypothetical protein